MRISLGTFLVVIFGASLLHAAAIIDDHFDDGDPTTNTLGIGTGFTDISQSGGFVGEMQSLLEVLGPGSSNIGMLHSNTAFGFMNPTGVTIRWEITAGHGTSRSTRDLAVIRSDFTSNGPESRLVARDNGEDQAIYLEMSDYFDDNSPVGKLRVRPGGGGAAQNLATWAWTWDLTNAAILELDLKDTGFAVRENGTQVAAGLWTSVTDAAGFSSFWSSSTAVVGMCAQSHFGGNAFLDFDRVIVGPTATAHPGDFDSDGDVDGADFVAWQTNFPKADSATLTQGDADGDGDVDGADFVVWQTNFPFTPGPGVSPVPEPQSLVLLAACTVLMAGVLRRSEVRQ